MGAVPARTLVPGSHIGAHLTFWRQRILGQTAMVVPSPPFSPGPRPEMEPLSKESLRRAALDARKAFVATLSDARAHAARAAACPAPHLACAEATVVGGYAPLGTEISPLLAMEEARAVGANRRLSRLSTIPPSRSASAPATRSSPARSGSCSRKRATPVVEPDLILVPLIAIDGARHPARPRQGPLRPRARPPEEERRAADRRRLAAAAAGRDHSRRRMGRPARRLRLARGPRAVQAH